MIRRVILPFAAAIACFIGTAWAQKYSGPGVSETEIKLGQTMPFSGPVSAYGIEGRVEGAYFQMLNDNGGINGRKVNLITLDDAYSPSKTIEQTRKLVEVVGVLAIVSTFGTTPNLAIQKYLNTKKVPQLLALSGISKWEDPEGSPWSTSFLPSYIAEATIFARYLLEHQPNAKVATLAQNDDVGREFVRGLRDGLGTKTSTMLVKETTYDLTDPTVDSQILNMKASGADTLVLIATGKFAPQAIRKAFETDWKPQTLIFSAANSIKASLEPAGLDRSVGMLTTVWLKTPGDPQWATDKGMLEYLAFMRKYMPDADPNDRLPSLGYTTAQLTAHILQRCGDDLSRENLMRQATSLHDVSLDLLLPGMTLNNSPTSRNPITQFQMARFDGKSWVPIGPILTAGAVR
jgi:branched-chain amino acid transport system substrate-binding protein